jgi:hypothetical protein
VRLGWLGGRHLGHLRAGGCPCSVLLYLVAVQVKEHGFGRRGIDNSIHVVDILFEKSLNPTGISSVSLLRQNQS